MTSNKLYLWYWIDLEPETGDVLFDFEQVVFVYAVLAALLLHFVDVPGDEAPHDFIILALLRHGRVWRSLWDRGNQISSETTKQAFAYGAFHGGLSPGGVGVAVLQHTRAAISTQKKGDRAKLGNRLDARGEPVV